MGCARAGASATAAPGPSASTPSPSPAPTASSAPHPGCLQRSASAGARWAGEPGGAAHDVPIASPGPRRMNGSGRAGGVQGLGRGIRGVLSHLQTPWPTQSGALPLLRSPPSSRGARRGRELGRKEPGKGGVGARKARAGGRRGRKRPPCARAGPRRVAARVAGPCNLTPGVERDRRDRPGPRGGPLPAGGARLALIGAAGRGRRELARSSVSIRDAKFLLGRRRR